MAKAKSTRDKNADEILAIFEFDRRTLQRYQKAGLPYTKASKGNPAKYNEGEVHSWMRAKGLTGEVGSNASTITGPIGEEINKAKLRKLNADADIFEMTRDERKGLLIEKAVAERANVTKFTVIRNKFIGLAASIAPTLTGLEAAEIQVLLESRIRDVLTELSQQ